MLTIATVLGSFTALFAVAWGVIKIAEYLGFIEIRDDEDVPW